MLNRLSFITSTVLLFHFTLGSVFIKDRLSSIMVRLDMGCLNYVGVMPHGIMDCARECLLVEKCEGFYMDEDLKCYIHFHCKLLDDRPYEVTYFRRLMTRDDCLNAGTWEPESQTCKCSGGLVGLRCERFAESCKELFQMGYPPGTRRPFVIQPSGFKPFLTHCAFVEGEVRTDIFFHPATGSLSFNRSLAEYITGFYNNSNEYWIGLEKMYVLNTVGMLSKISLFIAFSDDGFFLFVFREVTIGDTGTGYTFNYTEMRPSKYGPVSINTIVSNCVPKSGKPAPFSACDADNDDELHENCAANSGAGWWFSTCDPDPVCNPLGTPVTTGTANVTQENMRFNGLDLQAHASEFRYVRMYFFESWR